MRAAHGLHLGVKELWSLGRDPIMLLRIAQSRMHGRTDAGLDVFALVIPLVSSSTSTRPASARPSAAVAM